MTELNSNDECKTIINKTKLNKNINDVIIAFNYLWCDVKMLYYNNDFLHLTDEEKIESVTNSKMYKSLLMNYPIVLKMMVCVRDYSPIALRRYLFTLHKNSILNQNKMAKFKEDKNKFMKLYNQQKAFYPRFLYESKSEYRGFIKKFSDELYNKYCDILDEELKSFLNAQDKYNDFLETDKTNKGKNSIKDILLQISNGTFKGTEKEKDIILMLIKDKLANINSKELIQKNKNNNLLL
jgi:hypothetical protein